MRFITTLLILFFVATTANASNHSFKPADLLNEGTPSGKVPSGLSKAPGIQKQIPVSITNVQATSTTASSTTITWETDKLSDSKVVFYVGTSTASTSEVSDSVLVLDHEIDLNMLEASSTYSYFVVSEDEYGNVATSSINIFSTLSDDVPSCSEGTVASGACDGLLAKFNADISTSRSDGSIPRPIDSTRAVLAYGLENFSDTENPFSIVASSSLGLSYRLEPGQTPTFDLNASSSPYFADFVTNLTNGNDQNLDAGGVMFSTSGELITGSAGGNFESSPQRLDGNPDLDGYQINFVRFIVTKNNTFDGPAGVGQELEYTVEIWGEEEVVIPDDGFGPTITELTITPTTTNPGGLITFSVSAEDVNGVANVIYDIRYPNGTYVLRPNCNFLGAVSDICEFTESIDQGIRPALLGDYVIESVRAVDTHGNVAIYYPDGTASGTVSSSHSLPIPVIEITETPSFDLSWGSLGSADGQFNPPFGVTAGTSTVYVTDRDNHRIQRFDMDGNYISQWGSLGSGNGQFVNADNIAVDSQGNVYVSDWDLNRVQKFDPTGNYLLQWGSGGPAAGEFSRAYGIAIDSNDDVYVADRLNHRVQKFDSNGNFITEWGSQGGGNGQFDNPVTVGVDNNDNVYVADQTHSRVQKFDSSGSFITSWGGFGSGDGQFNDPYGIAVDSFNYVYVVDRVNNRVQKFDEDGGYITEFGVNGTGDGEFQFPAGIAINDSDDIFVVDATNSRVQKWNY